MDLKGFAYGIVSEGRTCYRSPTLGEHALVVRLMSHKLQQIRCILPYFSVRFADLNGRRWVLRSTIGTIALDVSPVGGDGKGRPVTIRGSQTNYLYQSTSGQDCDFDQDHVPPLQSNRISS